VPLFSTFFFGHDQRFHRVLRIGSWRDFIQNASISRQKSVLWSRTDSCPTSGASQSRFGRNRDRTTAGRISPEQRHPFRRQGSPRGRGKPQIILGREMLPQQPFRWHDAQVILRNIGETIIQRHKQHTGDTVRGGLRQHGLRRPYRAIHREDRGAPAAAGLERPPRRS